MQTEGRDASLRAIFAEVMLILCKSKTIKTKQQTFNLCFLHSLTQRAAQEAQNQHEKKDKKKIKKKQSKKNNQKKTIK